MSESSPEMQATSSLGPGARLQEARLKKKLTLEAVAEQLHLSKQQIEAIENNNFTYISSLAYVRGHLRMYARMVDLPVNEILKAFDSLDLKPAIPPASPPPLAVKTKMQLEKQKAKSPRWWFVLLAVLIVILLGIVLRHSRSSHATPIPANTNHDAANANNAVSAPQPLQPQPMSTAVPNASETQAIPLAIPPDKPITNSPAVSAPVSETAPHDSQSAE